MSKRVDLTGQRFGRLQVIGLSHVTARRLSVWACVCDCGGLTLTQAGGMRSGRIISCGCARKERAALAAVARHAAYRAVQAVSGKKCAVCHETKPLKAFPGRRTAYCSACHKTYKRSWYWRNVDRERTRQRHWRYRNAASASEREWRWKRGTAAGRVQMVRQNHRLRGRIWPELVDLCELITVTKKEMRNGGRN